MKLKIGDKEYSIRDIKDELRSSWQDGRPYIVEYYELRDDEEDKDCYLTIWSTDAFELSDVPMSATPLITGDITEIRGV